MYGDEDLKGTQLCTHHHRKDRSFPGQSPEYFVNWVVKGTTNSRMCGEEALKPTQRCAYNQDQLIGSQLCFSGIWQSINLVIFKIYFGRLSLSGSMVKLRMKI